MRTEYRFYVGVEDTRTVAAVVARHATGATITPSIGLWRGKIEASTVITILAPPEHDVEDCDRFGKFCGDVSALVLAQDLQDTFDQEEVLTIKTEVTEGV